MMGIDWRGGSLGFRCRGEQTVDSACADGHGKSASRAMSCVPVSVANEQLRELETRRKI